MLSSLTTLYPALTEPILPPAPPTWYVDAPDWIDRRRPTLTGGWSGPVAPPPTPFVLVIAPERVPAGPRAALGATTVPILPPPVPYTLWGFDTGLVPRWPVVPIPFRGESFFEPIRPPAPPLSWVGEYPAWLPPLSRQALTGTTQTGTVAPVVTHIFRRTLQLRIGTRTEPEKL